MSVSVRRPVDDRQLLLGHAVASRLQLVLAAAASLLVAVLGWLHRWTADDALITVRVSQQILSGHGPVFNTGERVEASTSVVWPWLITAFAWLPWELAEIAVVLGIGLSSAAVWVGVRAAYRFHLRVADERRPEVIVPVGVLVVLAVPACWYYFSSGLESGLVLFWLAVAWAGLVGVEAGRLQCEVWTALWLGFGPLIRPELAVVSVVFGSTVVWLARPNLRRGAVLAALLVAPGACYEVFRAAYFGVLVPNPAIAKEAAAASWGQGAWYLLDLLLVYHLWMPLLGLAAVACRWFPAATTRSRLVVGAPILAGLLIGGYIVRTGGDFMHARLLLPPLFLVVLPLFVGRVSGRSVSVTAALVLAWASVCAAFLRLPYAGGESHLIVDERSEWVALTGSKFPVTAADHRLSVRVLADAVDRAVAQERRVVVFRTDRGPESGVAEVELRDDVVGPVVIAGEVLGATGVIRSDDVPVVDLRGLADPITAHARLEGRRGRPGHEKWMPDAWLVARFGNPRVVTPSWISPLDVDSARAALACPALVELQASYEEPLTWRRAWKNLTGSVRRTALRYSPDPTAAVREMCD